MWHAFFLSTNLSDSGFRYKVYRGAVQNISDFGCFVQASASRCTPRLLLTPVCSCGTSRERSKAWSTFRRCVWHGREHVQRVVILMMFMFSESPPACNLTRVTGQQHASHRHEICCATWPRGTLRSHSQLDFCDMLQVWVKVITMAGTKISLSMKDVDQSTGAYTAISLSIFSLIFAPFLFQAPTSRLSNPALVPCDRTLRGLAEKASVAFPSVSMMTTAADVPQNNSKSAPVPRISDSRKFAL